MAGWLGVPRFSGLWGGGECVPFSLLVPFRPLFSSAGKRAED